MHKTITIAIIIAIIWLTFSSAHVSDAIINFIVVGEVPGSHVILSPSMMLAIMTAVAGLVLFEMLARRIGVLRTIHYHFYHLSAKQARLPKRRFKRA